MRMPRDWSGEELVRRLSRLDYWPTRQTGSHVRLTRSGAKGEHHITIPLHRNLRVGTLNSILNDVAQNVDMDRDDLLEQLQ